MKTAVVISVLVLLALDGVSAEQDSKWAQPPGEESSDVAKLIDEAAAGMGTREGLEKALRDPRYMPLHPYPRFREAVERNAPVGQLEYAGPPEPGEPLTVRLKLTDGGGKPLEGVVVYAYQTSAKGYYAQDAAHVQATSGDVRHARLFGYVRTDSEGRAELRTIRPGGYPNSDLPQHIHVSALREERSIGVSEIVFSDDPRLARSTLERTRQDGALVTTPAKKDGRWLVEATWVLSGS